MQDALSIAVQSLHNDMQRIETHTHNLTNATATGYRRQISLQSAAAFDQVFQAESQVQQGQPGSRTLAIDQSVGVMKPTGKALDLAIAGEGYFAVQTAQGVAYTRRGDFRVDAEGRLVTANGEAVLSEQGQLRLPHGSYAVDKHGAISVDGRQAGQLQLVEIKREHALVALGNGLYRLAEAGINPAAINTEIRSGYLEAANVSTAQEMVGLMETMRHFEANQKLVQGYDDALSKAIQKLGEF